jgi:hypothetical protein
LAALFRQSRLSSTIRARGFGAEDTAPQDILEGAMRAVIGAMVAGMLAMGCSAKTVKPPVILPPDQVAKIHATFEEARDAMIAHDKQGWTEKDCRDTAAIFGEVATRIASTDREASLASRYDQGLSLARCQLHEDAAAVFEALLKDAPNHHRAQVQVALHRWDARGEAYLPEAIAMMRDAVKGSRFQSPEALVSLAILQMRRADATPDDDGDDDFDRARRNLRRALAVNDSYMPAYNQLAINQLEIAKRQAGRTGSGLLATAGEQRARPDTAALELAALVTSQAMMKDPTYAPIHNTAGLIDAELGNLSGAARAFGRARKLDPRLFEAHMNYAAVNLQFRGFARAEEAYRAALVLDAKSYDAHLGLALALRGQIGDTPDGMKVLATAEKALHKAKALAPERPEAYFNEAILVQEFLARGAGPEAKPMLKRAKTLYAAFAERAKGQPNMKEALARANERVKDIDQFLVFLEETNK